MEIVRDWGPRTGSPLKGSLVNSLMKATTDESRSGKPDKKRMVPRVNAPSWSLARGFLFAIRNCYLRKESHGFTNTIARVENLNAS